MTKRRACREEVAAGGESAQSRSTDSRSREERLTVGKALRQSLAHDRHAVWKRPTRTRDPVKILAASNRGRLPELVPIRFGRMLRSPFTFLRGSAGLMAHDLATTPSTIFGYRPAATAT